MSIEEKTKGMNRNMMSDSGDESLNQSFYVEVEGGAVGVKMAHIELRVSCENGSECAPLVTIRIGGANAVF